MGIDSSIFSHPTTWKASGHIDAFNDPLIDNKDSKKRYRADNLIEEYITKCESNILKEQKKQEKRFGDKFNKETFLKLLEIYSSNEDKFYLDINFCDTGAAKITKINNEKLNETSQLLSREYSIKNLTRSIVYKLKKNK